MKYTLEITINQPLDKVIELFDNPDNLKHWQPGFVSHEHLSGEPGQPGAKAKMIFNHNGRKMEMIETITSRNLPGEFSGTYETNGVVNTQINHFEEIDSSTTLWSSTSEFKAGGFMMKLMMFFMPGAFKKQSQAFMDHFKAYAEDGTSLVAD